MQTKADRCVVCRDGVPHAVRHRSVEGCRRPLVRTVAERSAPPRERPIVGRDGGDATGRSAKSTASHGASRADAAVGGVVDASEHDRGHATTDDRVRTRRDERCDETTREEAAPMSMTSPDHMLEGRVAIVTGASSGLGERFARVLHACGADIVAAARRTDRLESLRAELGDRVHPVAVDLAVTEDRERLISVTLDRLGAVDLLVNNAGVGEPHPAEDEPLDVFRSVLEVNLVAVFHLCQLAGRPMLAAGRGAIVNVASIFGLVASAPVAQASYCASKGAVVNLTRELAAQWARRGVRVNALAPGWFPTEMNSEMWSDESMSNFVRRNTPMGRTGDLKELDDALRFLVSDCNAFYTGQVLTVDGGWTAR